jgi:hypothetical protein
VSRATQAARYRDDFDFPRRSAAGPKPTRASFYGELGRHILLSVELIAN